MSPETMRELIKTNSPLVVIEIRGGTVVETYSNIPMVNVAVIDWDQFVSGENGLWLAADEPIDKVESSLVDIEKKYLDVVDED